LNIPNNNLDDLLAVLGKLNENLSSLFPPRTPVDGSPGNPPHPREAYESARARSQQTYTDVFGGSTWGSTKASVFGTLGNRPKSQQTQLRDLLAAALAPPNTDTIQWEPAVKAEQAPLRLPGRDAMGRIMKEATPEATPVQKSETREHFFNTLGNRRGH
jgi:hypothetical protein